MGSIQVDDEANERTRSPHQVGKTDAKGVERMGGTMGDHKQETKARERSRACTREGAGQGRKRQGQAGHTVVCAAPTQGPEGEGARYQRAVIRCPCGYVPERQHPGGGRTGGPVLDMHQGGGAGTVAGPENDSMGVPDRNHAHYGRQGTVVGAGTAAAQGGAGGRGGPWGVLRFGWGEEQQGKRRGVQIGWNTVRGLQEEDDGVVVSFWLTDTGRPEEEVPIVPVGHKCGESARRI